MIANMFLQFCFHNNGRFGRQKFKEFICTYLQGLYDQRSHGNSVKFTCDMKHFVKGLLVSHRSLTSSEVQQALANEFGATISLTVINDFRREHDLIRSQDVFQEFPCFVNILQIVFEML